MKQCRKCMEFKPFSEFSPGPSKDGFQTRCKHCRADDERERRARKGVQVRAPLRERNAQDDADAKLGLKRCRRCDEKVSLDSFNIDNSCRDGRSLYCSACIKSFMSESYQRHRDKRIEEGRKHRAENPKYYADYKVRNKDRIAQTHRSWYARNRQRKLEQNAEWIKNNPDFTARKRAKRRGAVKRGEKIDLKQLRLRDTKCYICRECVDYALLWPDPQSPTLDHINPIINGGSHATENVAYVHKVCNEEKGAKDYTALFKEVMRNDCEG